MMIYITNLGSANSREASLTHVCDDLIISNKSLMRHQYIVVF
jgi:hypothetical protein